jgi:hypothetical protein
MVGRNALLVAKEHGHRPLTMLTVYAAWTEGAPEHDIRAIRAARNPQEWKTIRHSDATGAPVKAANPINSAAAARRPITGTFRAPDDRSRANNDGRTRGHLALDLAPAPRAGRASPLNYWRNHGGADGTRTEAIAESTTYCIRNRSGPHQSPEVPGAGTQAGTRTLETRHKMSRDSRACSLSARRSLHCPLVRVFTSWPVSSNRSFRMY